MNCPACGAAARDGIAFCESCGERVRSPSPCGHLNRSGVSFCETCGEPNTSTERIDLNSATVGEISAIPGVGPALAERIVAARPFDSLQALEEVSGVGPKTLEAIAGRAEVRPVDTTPASRPDVITIRFRAEEDGRVSKVLPDTGAEFGFDEPYVANRHEILAALQQSVIPFNYDADFQAEVGQTLTNALLRGSTGGGQQDLVTLFREAQSKTSGPITFQLTFDEGAFRPAQLPWELMRDEAGHVVADERIRLNRFITYFGDREPFTEVDPMRVLYLESRPKDADRLPDTTSAYRDAVDRLGGRIETELVRHATFADLESAVRGGGYHVVHYDGHGYFDGATGYLLFEDGSRHTDWVDAGRLTSVLGGSDARLVVLGACQGSTVGGMGLFQSTAPALIRAGVPAVVANQFSVFVDAEADFTHEFYASIARGESISAAVADGRKAMTGHRGQFFLPTLYLRIADGEGYLFGGEPETHRRWRMTEMQKLAAWWWALSAIQQALYLEGALRWQGTPVEPAELPEPRRPDDDPLDRQVTGSPRRQETRQEQEEEQEEEQEQREEESTPTRRRPEDDEVWSPVGIWRIVGEPSTGETTGDDESGYISTTLTARPFPGFESSVGKVGSRFRRTGPRTFEGEWVWLAFGTGAEVGWGPVTLEMTDPNTMVARGSPPYGGPESVLTSVRVGRDVVDELIEQGYGAPEEPKEQVEPAVSIERFWYAGSHAGHPCFHAEVRAHGLQGVELRAGVFVTVERGNKVTNDGDPTYYTPDGQLTVQQNLTPAHGRARFPELEFTIPFNQFYKGNYTYDATLEIWRRVGTGKGEVLATADLPGTFWVDRTS